MCLPPLSVLRGSFVGGQRGGIDLIADTCGCRANLVDEEEAWFALSAVAFRTEAVEGRDGFVVLMPPRGSSTAIGEDERSGEEGGGEMDVDDGVDEEGEGKETGVVKREPEGQREFLLWEMVNCVDGR